MSSIYTEIDRCRRDILIERINEELKNTQVDSERYKFLNSIINKFNNNTNPLEETIKKVEENAYNKMWSKLTPFHKMQKIREYLKDNYDDPKEIAKLEKEYLKKIEAKKLNTSKQVKYDKDTCKIIQINE